MLDLIQYQIYYIMNNNTMLTEKEMYTIENYFIGDFKEWCHLIRNKYGNIICRIYIKDFQHTHDHFLLAHFAAKEIVENLNNSISY